MKSKANSSYVSHWEGVVQHAKIFGRSIRLEVIIEMIANFASPISPKQKLLHYVAVLLELYKRANRSLFVKCFDVF